MEDENCYFWCQLKLKSIRGIEICVYVFEPVLFWEANQSWRICTQWYVHVAMHCITACASENFWFDIFPTTPTFGGYSPEELDSHSHSRWWRNFLPTFPVFIICELWQKGELSAKKGENTATLNSGKKDETLVSFGRRHRKSRLIHSHFNVKLLFSHNSMTVVLAWGFSCEDEETGEKGIFSVQEWFSDCPTWNLAWLPVRH